MLTENYILCFIISGPPGPPAGVYVDELSVTAYSARLVWTVGVDTNHGDPVTSFDIEAETQYHPGEWQILKTGKWISSVSMQLDSDSFNEAFPYSSH